MIGRFIPLSGLEGVNLMSVDERLCPWYDGPSLVEFLGNVGGKIRF